MNMTDKSINRGNNFLAAALYKLVPIIFLIIGIYVFFGPIITSKFDYIWADDCDGLYQMYIYEHIYLFLKHESPHLSLFSPPFFFPNKDTLLYCDTFLSISPIYIFFRHFFTESISFSLLLMTAITLDYTVLYFLLRNKFKFNIFASTIGAYILTFSVFNYVNLTYDHHSQLLYTFFLLISLYALLSINKHNSLIKNIFCVNVFYIFIVLSVYCTYVLTWYYCFSIFIFCLGMLLFKKSRRKLFIFIRRFYLLFILNIIPALILLSPLVYHYLQTGRIGWWYYSTLTIGGFLTNYSIYFAPLQHLNNPQSIEHNSSVEYITFIIGLIGIWQSKKYRKPLFAFLIIIFLLAISFKNYAYSIWMYIHQYFPGANGIRTNERIIIIFHFIMAFGCANFINNIVNSKNSIKKIVLGILISAVICVGQLSFLKGYGYTQAVNIYDNVIKVRFMDLDRYSQLIQDNKCEVIQFKFNLPDEGQLTEAFNDALTMNVMWLALKNKVYIINGYSSYVPGNVEDKLTPEMKKKVCTFEETFNRIWL